MKEREEKKDHLIQLDNKYASQIAELEKDGIKTKNKRLLIELLEKANGQIDVVKQLLVEKNEQKNGTKSSTMNTTEENHEITIDDIDHLKTLRQAGIDGNPTKILALFHECNQSIEKTIARYEKERTHREEQTEKRAQVKRISHF